MFAQAVNGIAKDSFLAAVSLYLSALLAVSGLNGLLAICGNNCSDIFLLVGAILASFMVVRLLAFKCGMAEKSKTQTTLLGLLVASTVLLVLQNKTGLFFGNEELVLLSLLFFGTFKVSEVLWERYGRMLPGMVDRVLIVGNGVLAADMEALTASSDGRFRLSGFVHLAMDRDEDHAAAPNILRRARELKANTIVVSLTERRGVFPVQDMLNCKLSGIEVLDAPTFYERVHHKLMIESINPSSLIFSSGFKFTRIRRMTKRALDLVLGSVGLLLVAPLLPLVALAIKLDSPGPVLFTQLRVGAGDREFTIYKFRSMRADAEKDSGAVWASTGDPRITRLGSFLRKSRIDEIPQLWNVLRGDMSLVGPRPERPEFVAELKKEIPYYSERHFVKPGVTGWAQVRYPYGASVQDAIEKLRYDLYYIKNYSLLFDLRIIWRTVGVVLMRKLGR